MNIRKLICALLAMLLLALPVLAEEEDDFGFDFSDDGYTGEWLELTDLGIELCLPDGWDLLEAGEDVDFDAKASDGSAALSILKVADDVTDLVKWAEEHVESYELDDEGFFDTLYTEDDAANSQRQLASYMSQMILPVMMEDADVKDNRARFY